MNRFGCTFLPVSAFLETKRWRYERRRRQASAEVAEGGGVWGGCVPLPTGGGAVSPPQKFFYF